MEMTQFKQDILKIVLDKFLMGALLAAFALYLGRVLERYKSELGYRRELALKRLDDAHLLAKLVAEYHHRYIRWLDKLDDVEKRLQANSSSPAEIKEVIRGWNDVDADFAAKVHPLQTTVAARLSERLNVYHGVASQLGEVFHKPGAEATRWRALVSDRSFRADLEAAYGKFLESYHELRWGSDAAR